MMVWRCGGCVPSCLFLGATELKSRKKKYSTDKQTDLTVIWDKKSTKTDFLSGPKSVDRKTKKLDRQADRQSADLDFWDTLIRIHLLCVGWRNLFSSCAVVSVFCSGGK